MNLIDVILIVLVSGFVFFGLFFGLARTLGSLIGTIIGLFLTNWLLGPFLTKFGFLFGDSSVGKIVAFILLLFVVTRVIGIILWVLGKVFGLLAWIPFAGVIDKLLGGVFGFIEGIVFVGIGLYFALQYLPDDAVRATLAASMVGKYLLAITAALQVLIPFKTTVKPT